MNLAHASAIFENILTVMCVSRVLMLQYPPFPGLKTSVGIRQGHADGFFCHPGRPNLERGDKRQGIHRAVILFRGFLWTKNANVSRVPRLLRRFDGPQVKNCAGRCHMPNAKVFPCPRKKAWCGIERGEGSPGCAL